jgi:polyisoprenoid-binding protein YceI
MPDRRSTGTYSTVAAWLESRDGLEITLSRFNTSVRVALRMFGVHVIHGWFEDLRGELALSNRGTLGGAVSVELAAESLRTGLRWRDRLLHGPDFLDTATYPVITCRAMRVQRRSSHLLLDAALTLRDVTRDVEIACTLHGGARPDGLPTAASLVGALTLRRSSFDAGERRRRLRSHLVGELVSVRAVVHPRLEG